MATDAIRCCSEEERATRACCVISSLWNRTKWSGVTHGEAYERSAETQREFCRDAMEKWGCRAALQIDKDIVLKAHDFGFVVPDTEVVNGAGDRFFIELKDKNRRIHYRDNGVNERLVEDYLVIQELFETPIIVLFRDDPGSLARLGVVAPFGREWYGNFLGWLNRFWKRTPVSLGTGNGGQTVRYYPLSRMWFGRELIRQRCFRLNYWGRCGTA